RAGRAARRARPAGAGDHRAAPALAPRLAAAPGAALPAALSSLRTLQLRGLARLARRAACRGLLARGAAGPRRGRAAISPLAPQRGAARQLERRLAVAARAALRRAAQGTQERGTRAARLRGRAPAASRHAHGGGGRRPAALPVGAALPRCLVRRP